MLVCLLDLESTGLDTKTSLITQIGAIMVDPTTWEYTNGFVPFNSYLYDETYPELHKDVVRVTGITDEFLKANGIPPFQGLANLVKMLSQADYIITYNASYDVRLLEANLERYGIVPVKEYKYICGLRDVDYPDYMKCRKLSHLALDHGVPVNPESLHNALGDLRVMLELFRVGGYKFDDMVRNNIEPNIVIRAMVGYEDREVAKNQKYSWEKTSDLVFPKSWVKTIKASALEKEKEALKPFEVAIVKELNHEQKN